MVTISSLLPPSGSFFKAATTKPLSPLQALAERDPERAQKIEETQNQLRQTLASLKSSKTDVAEQRKASAQQKIQRIKEQIKTLRMMSSMDPKIIARQLAQLSKELASAIKDYASAGGTAIMGTDTSTSSSATAVAPVEQASQDNTKQQADSFIAQESDILVPKDNNAENPVFSAVSASDSKDKQTPSVSSPNGDDEFINEIKKLVEEIKTMMRQQKARLKHDTDPFAEQDIRETERALREISQTLSAMSNASGTHVGTLNISI
jgi:hypothetical protein